MPPKKAPIYCLVHGNPESSVFRIKYDKNMTIDELRKVIWKEKIEVPEHVKAKDLILYQVDINLNTQNLKRTALGNQDANIVNDLGGQVLSPMDTIKEIFPVLANKHIYIIVCVPDVAIRRNDDVIIARLDKLDQNVDRIDKNIEDIKREKSSVHISG
ncbi:3763_t:CDS:2, partial [Rhizophagus irregularis]